jgi:hypothetical protein
MKSIYVSASLAMVLLSLAVVSAFAAYPPDEPGAPSVLQPPVLLVPDKVITEALCFHYADGRNVTLTEPPRMEVLATSTAGSITFDVLLVPLFNGTSGCCYSYGLNSTLPGFPTGQVNLYIVAYSLTDSFGHWFPTVNTLIGTIIVSSPSPTSPASSSSQPPSPSSSSPGQAAGSSNTPGLYRDAQATSQESRVAQSPPNLIPVVLVLLVVVGTALILVPRRRQ